jgi:hypothetical protein
MIYSLKIIMVLFVAPFLETHVFVIAMCATSSLSSSLPQQTVKFQFFFVKEHIIHQILILHF